MNRLVAALFTGPLARPVGRRLAALVAALPFPLDRFILPRVPMFDAEHYRRSNPDLHRLRNLWAHYLAHGAAEGRDPHPLFSTAWYLAQNADVSRSGANPLVHYWEHGRHKGLLPRPAAGGLREEPRAKFRRSARRASVPADGPLISILVPAGPQALGRTVDSVRAQTYERWRLHLCGAARDIRGEYGGTDTRIESEADLNAALDTAAGDYLVVLDGNDELDPDALAEVAALLAERPETDAVYTDEDTIDASGARTGVLLKPGWSPELLRGVDYVGRLLAVRTSLARRAGGFNAALDLDFVLRVSELTSKIAHIPRILYHRSMSPAGTGWRADAVNAHLSRLGIEARAEPHPTLSDRLMIIPARASSFARVIACIREPSSDAVLDGFRESLSYSNLEVRTEAAIAADLPDGCFVLWLDSDMRVLTPDLVDHLLFYCRQPGVAAVSPLIIEGDRVWCSGLVLGMDGPAGRVMRGWPADSDGCAGSLSCAREVSALSGECMMMSAAVLRRAGLPSRFYRTSLFRGADLSMRARVPDLRNIVTPRAVVRRTGDTSAAGSDRLDAELFRDRWADEIAAGDPYYNPAFVLESPGYRTDHQR